MANSFYKVMVRTANGVSVLMDVSDTTANVSDVSSGKTFYLSNGTKAIGSGGADTPDTPDTPDSGGSYWDGEFEMEDATNE